MSAGTSLPTFQDFGHVVANPADVSTDPRLSSSCSGEMTSVVSVYSAGSRGVGASEQ